MASACSRCWKTEFAKAAEDRIDGCVRLWGVVRAALASVYSIVLTNFSVYAP